MKRVALLAIALPMLLGCDTKVKDGDHAYQTFPSGHQCMVVERGVNQWSPPQGFSGDWFIVRHTEPRRCPVYIPYRPYWLYTAVLLEDRTKDFEMAQMWLYPGNLMWPDQHQTSVIEAPTAGCYDSNNVPQCNEFELYASFHAGTHESLPEEDHAQVVMLFQSPTCSSCPLSWGPEGSLYISNTRNQSEAGSYFPY